MFDLNFHSLRTPYFALVGMYTNGCEFTEKGDEFSRTIYCRLLLRKATLIKGFFQV